MDSTPPTIDLFVAQTDHELRMLGRFIHATQRGIEEVRQKEADQLEKQRAEIRGEFMAVISAGIDHVLAHTNAIPRLVLYGQVLALYSFLEARLRLLCDEARHRDQSLAWKPEDFAGNMSIGTFEIFLTRAVDARVSVWGSMNTLRLARNCIAHANGWIDRMDRGKRELRKRIGEVASLEVNEGRLVVSPTYVEDAYRDCHTLFSEAFSSLGFGHGLMPFEYPPETGVRVEGSGETQPTMAKE